MLKARLNVYFCVPRPRHFVRVKGIKADFQRRKKASDPSKLVAGDRKARGKGGPTQESAQSSCRRASPRSAQVPVRHLNAVTARVMRFCSSCHQCYDIIPPPGPKFSEAGCFPPPLDGGYHSCINDGGVNGDDLLDGLVSLVMTCPPPRYLPAEQEGVDFDAQSRSAIVEPKTYTDSAFDEITLNITPQCVPKRRRTA